MILVTLIAAALFLISLGLLGALFYGLSQWQRREGKAVVLLSSILLMLMCAGSLLLLPFDIYIHDTYFMSLWP